MDDPYGLTPDGLGRSYLGKDPGLVFLLISFQIRS